MQEFLTIIQVGIFIFAIVSFFSNQRNKALVKERKAELLSTKRDTELSDKEHAAISQLLDCDVESSTVYYITEHFEPHVLPATEDGGDEMYFFTLGDYPVMMSNKALVYLDIEATFAEVVVVDNLLIVVRLNDYSIVDEVNDTLAEIAGQEQLDDNQPSSDASPLFDNQQASDRQALMKEELQDQELKESEIEKALIAKHQIESAYATPPQTVLKSERPATLTEARYLSPPFYNVLVPFTLVVAAAIFSHITKLDLVIEPVWLAAAILITVCVITLLFLKREGPTPDPATSIVQRYFGKIEAVDTSANKTWIVFIAPNGEASKAWMPSHWQSSVVLNRDVQFEIEQSQSAVMCVGLNEISENDTIKKKPQYIAAAMGLLLGSFFIAANTEFEWRDASIAMLKSTASYEINNGNDWPTDTLQAGEHLSIKQPRLCLESRNANDNTTSYCQQFQYALHDAAFKVSPDPAPIQSYKHFIRNQPDYTPEISENLYNYMVTVAKMKKQFSPDGFKMRVRHRSEMMMFDVASLLAIAHHIEPYCSLPGVKTATDSAKTTSLTTACSAFKAEYALLWREATYSDCTNECWGEAVRGDKLVGDTALRTSDDIGSYLAKLRKLKKEIWKKTKSTLTMPSPDSEYIDVHWSGERSEDLRNIATLRAMLDQSNVDKRIERLDKLLPLQTAAANQTIEATVLSVTTSGEQLTLTLAPKISAKQAITTVIHLAMLAAFGVMIALLLLAYLFSGKPRKEKRSKSEDAWIS